MKIAAENTVEQKEFVSKEKYEKLLSDYEYLKQQLSDLKRMIFGSKSERFIPTDESQLHLFDSSEEETKENRRRDHPGRAPELLEYNPAKIFVRKIVRPKYANPENEGVVIADLPSLPIPKGNARASMLAHMTVSKFVDHLPIILQIKINCLSLWNINSRMVTNK